MTPEEIQEMRDWAALEQWHPIPNYSGYEVSDHGRVRSWRHKNGWRKNPYLLKLNKTKKYYIIQLWINGVCYTKTVHHLVLSAFVGPQPFNMEACHNDGDGFRNHISNLRWDTPSNNAIDKLKQGKEPRGGRYSAKFTPDSVKEIRKLYDEGWGMREIARKYRVFHSSIRMIVYKRSWSHVD